MPGSIDVTDLARRLAPLSHGTEALGIIRDALGQVEKRQRQAFLNEHLLCAPIRYEEVGARMSKPPEPFQVLQGDVIRTDAAYILGSRQVGAPSYVVATSTCDVVLGRRETALLLRVQPRRLTVNVGRDQLRNDLANLIAFKTSRYFYLPPLPDDDAVVLFNVVLVDPFAQCSNQTLAFTERRASMTLLGWRLFGAGLRRIQVREAEEEVAIRTL